jgi:hypothetical protein
MTRYCPKCRGEYQDWVQKCHDCGVELVDSLDGLETEKESKPRYSSDDNTTYTTEPVVVIAEFTDMLDAKLAQEVLESEGITGFVPDRESVSSWLGMLPQEEAKLIVKETDADKALEILEKRGLLEKNDNDDSDTIIK